VQCRIDKINCFWGFIEDLYFIDGNRLATDATIEKSDEWEESIVKSNAENRRFCLPQPHKKPP